LYHTLFATADGRMYDFPGLALAGRWGDRWVEPEPDEMMLLPDGATLVMLPGRHPLGIDARGRFQPLAENPYGEAGPVWAVGALLPQGFTRTLLPAFPPPRSGEKPLHLLGFTAVGVRDGRYWVAAMATDANDRWNPRHFNTADLADRVRDLQSQYPGNRLYRQFAHCALVYGCFTAQNLFYRRWEAAVAASPSCNASCLGCISLQPAECCPSPQQRIDFAPTTREMVEVAVPHLAQAEHAIISWGQGCEGEPLRRYRAIAAAIGEIRGQTARGTININTNGGSTRGVEAVCLAGADSLRVSINSAVPETYHAYYRPGDYNLGDVRRSLALASQAGVYVSLNLLTFPGVNDREEELEALVELIAATGVKQVQLRNLNIDPDLYMAAIPPASGELLGITGLVEVLRAEFPALAIGNYSRPVR